MKDKEQLKKVRKLLLLFMVALFLSGLTAMPVDLELEALVKLVPQGSALGDWLSRVLRAYKDVDVRYPFLLYGYDWLAFAHFVLTVLFIGPYRDPVRNIWVIQFGMIACIMVFPLALMAGPARGIPIGWQLIDCSFGIVGFIPLWLSYKIARRLEDDQNLKQHYAINY